MAEKLLIHQIFLLARKGVTTEYSKAKTWNIQEIHVCPNFQNHVFPKIFQGY